MPLSAKDRAILRELAAISSFIRTGLDAAKARAAARSKLLSVMYTW